MISFGIMSGLLVIMACVVHFDLLGWFPVYPYYGRRTAVREDRDLGPDAALNFEDGPWIPRPGTDPYVASYPRPTVLVRDYADIDYDEDDDDFWTEVSDADDSCTAVGSGDETGTCAASGGADDWTWSEHDRTVADDVRTVSSSPVPDDDGGDADHDDGGDADHDDGDYAAAGEERDSDVF